MEKIQHPLSDFLPTFSGVMVVSVPPGTVIERNGVSVEVTDDHMVRDGRNLYVTRKVFAVLRKAAGIPTD